MNTPRVATTRRTHVHNLPVQIYLHEGNTTTIQADLVAMLTQRTADNTFDWVLNDYDHVRGWQRYRATLGSTGFELCNSYIHRKREILIKMKSGDYARINVDKETSRAFFDALKAQIWQQRKRAMRLTIEILGR